MCNFAPATIDGFRHFEHISPFRSLSNRKKPRVCFTTAKKVPRVVISVKTLFHYHELVKAAKTPRLVRSRLRQEESLARPERNQRDLQYELAAKHPQANQRRIDNQEASLRPFAREGPEEHGSAPQGPALRFRQAQRHCERPHLAENVMGAADEGPEAFAEEVQADEEDRQAFVPRLVHEIEGERL